MKRRQFVASSVLATATLTTASAAVLAAHVAPKKELYELRTYELRFGSPQSTIENYLIDALIPDLIRQGIKTIGVFREMGKSDPAKLYVLIPHGSMDTYATTASRMTDDSIYAKASQAYIEATPE